MARASRARLPLLLGTLLALSAAPRIARAVPQRLRDQVSGLEQQARSLSIRFKTQASSKTQLAEHRLVDAQVLYNLRDYTRAAILLLDYVHKYKGTRGYGAAVFYLADSLYHKRDFLSARRYFRLIVERVKGKYYQESLQRLVELSLRTGDSTNVQTYLSLLSNIPPSQLKPSVPYVRGKYYFFKRRTDDAIRAFRAIPKQHRYYMHAQYFIGASLVRKRQYSAALKTFRALLREQPKSAGQKQIRQLTHLAIGRLLYQKNKISQAIDRYQKVSRRSKEFDAALYEIAWAFIKAKQYKRALRALDLLVLAQPNSPFVPEVKVLQGNLLIRLEQWGRATRLFSKAREKFVPVHKRMKQLLEEHADPNVFFDVLLGRKLGAGALAVSIKVPNLAIHWVKEKSKVKRALNLVRDMHDIKDSIDDAKRLIVRLERRINSPAKIRIFPEFATARSHAVEVENRLALTRRQILIRERKLVRSVATVSERAELQRLADKRRSVERKIKRLPADVDTFHKRTQARVRKIERLERKLSKLQVLVLSLQAQLVAAEKYVADTAAARKKTVREEFSKEVARIRAHFDTLASDATTLTQLLADARHAAGVGGPQDVADRGIKKSYEQIVAAEHQTLRGLRSRLSGSAGTEFDQLSALLARCDAVARQLTGFNGKLEQGVNRKLLDIRAAIAEEKARVAKYEVEAGEYKKQTDEIAGGITYIGFKQVAKRFYEIVVRADVGIIDVAWALKDTMTKKVSALTRQRKRDLKLLDDEFKEVLKEN